MPIRVTKPPLFAQSLTAKIANSELPLRQGREDPRYKEVSSRPCKRQHVSRASWLKASWFKIVGRPNHRFVRVAPIDDDWRPDNTRPACFVVSHRSVLFLPAPWSCGP